MKRLARVAVLLGVLAVTGCGQASGHDVPAVSNGELPVLATSQVPGIPSVTIRLTAAELGKDAVIPGLAAKISSWGFLGGRQRTFQGESHRLTFAVSRALTFRNAAGAQRYVAFVHEHQAAYFGVAVQAQPLSGPAVSGWRFVPPLCACHLANPVLFGVLNTGARVIWLEINGPTATPAVLVRLLDTVGNLAVAR